MCKLCIHFRVEGLGLRGLGYGAEGLGFNVEGFTV